MAANYNRRRYASYKRRSHGDYYVDGNVVRKYDVVREIEKKPAKRLSEQTRKNRERATHMSLGYVAFLCVSMCRYGRDQNKSDRRSGHAVCREGTGCRSSRCCG